MTIGLVPCMLLTKLIRCCCWPPPNGARAFPVGGSILSEMNFGTAAWKRKLDTGALFELE
eukprot:CAMPEP_0202061052 /NCGR_PEP_ID=MMETSP0963-20130614/39942_1 /ASSEMBLY_ACC=CAM_ASM_000494 /TAXON_ID=4773 /ORGANISM="Schizochytrium aggregatum, Strain ATCC28209" /LENGTH=59 /DNA_ID=CAMNT_0048627219 /DNA_START=81 /DNA_END=260 /DNA_ORIENTATION=+